MKPQQPLVNIDPFRREFKGFLGHLSGFRVRPLAESGEASGSWVCC